MASRSRVSRIVLVAAAVAAVAAVVAFRGRDHEVKYAAVPADRGDIQDVVGATGTKSVISNAVSLNVVVPKFLTVTPKPVSCTSASVFWTASLPMTVVANYGTVCTALNNATVASPP